MDSRFWRLAAPIAALLGVFAGSNAWAALSVDTVSARADLVSNASALIAIKGATASPQVSWDNRDITKLFSADPNNPGQYIGLVVGFVDGKNVPIQVRAGGEVATLTVVNHPVNKQIFSGPLQTPFVCELDALGLKPVNTSHLDPKNSDCTAASVVTYFYKNTAGTWKPFDAAAARPTDIMTTSINGQNVPLIVRQEKGVINRSGYIIDILHDPAAGPVASFLSKGGSAWNGKLIFSQGGGIGDGYHQGRGYGGLTAASQFIEDGQVGALDVRVIKLAHAVASGSLISGATSTDEVVAAETAYKIKEQFIKEFGVPVFTIGTGLSGGSAMTQVISNSYPGILDGIIPNWQFADNMTFLQPLYDCELLANVFKTGTWTRDQMNAVSGMYWGYCVSNATRYPQAQSDKCDQVVLTAVSKDPALAANPPRCTYQDDQLHTFGIDPATGDARNPFDNVGIQYGLVALNNGAISWDQFIDINQRIGGQDANGKITPARQVGDTQALNIAYQTGRVNEETGGLASIPQVATREYRDGDPFGRGDANVDVHAGIHSLIVQARLQKYDGSTASMAYLLTATAPGAYNLSVPGAPLNLAALDALKGMDEWLTAIKADTSSATAAAKVVADRPKDVVDTCYPAKTGGLTTAIVKITDQTMCGQIFPTTTDPRIAAGGPMTDDVFKCTLKPVDMADYKTAPTAAQLASLKTVFPDGVCDYTKPGVGQTQKITTWASFSDDGVYAGL